MSHPGNSWPRLISELISNFAIELIGKLFDRDHERRLSAKVIEHPFLNLIRLPPATYLGLRFCQFIKFINYKFEQLLC